LTRNLVNDLLSFEKKHSAVITKSSSMTLSVLNEAVDHMLPKSGLGSPAAPIAYLNSTDSNGTTI